MISNVNDMVCWWFYGCVMNYLRENLNLLKICEFVWDFGYGDWDYLVFDWWKIVYVVGGKSSRVCLGKWRFYLVVVDFFEYY